MPAIVATSQLPKWPVRISTPLPAASAATNASTFSTRTSASLRSADSQRKRRNSPSEPPQVRVVRLREPHDLRLRDGVAEHAAQVFEDHRAAQRQEAVQEPARERHVDAAPARPARPPTRCVRSWVSDSAIDAMRWRSSSACARGLHTICGAP